MHIEKVRRDNLNKFIMANYKNKRRFCLEYSLNYGNLHSILKGERPFGERLARDLESKLGLASGYFDQNEESRINETKIPIYSNKLSAGDGNNVFNEEIIGYHLLNTADLRGEGLDEKNLCAFIIRGDSMMPEIQDGAKVLVDVSQKHLADNKIYAISINNEIFVKKVFTELGSDNIIVRSTNQEYPDKVYRSADELKVIGRVVYLLGKRL